MAIDLWTEATLDLDQEHKEQRFTAARVAVAPLWTFLAAAQSGDDFGNRLALVADKIDAACERLASGAEFAVLRRDVEAALQRDYEIMDGQRKKALRDEFLARKRVRQENARRASIDAQRKKAATGDGSNEVSSENAPSDERHSANTPEGGEHVGPKDECPICSGSSGEGGDGGGESAAEAREGRRKTASSAAIDAARNVVNTQTAQKVDGMLLDLFTASHIIAVYDGLTKEENKAKFAAMDLPAMADLAFRVLKKAGSASEGPRPFVFRSDLLSPRPPGDEWHDGFEDGYADAKGGGGSPEGDSVLYGRGYENGQDAGSKQVPTDAAGYGPTTVAFNTTTTGNAARFKVRTAGQSRKSGDLFLQVTDYKSGVTDDEGDTMYGGGTWHWEITDFSKPTYSDYVADGMAMTEQEAWSAAEAAAAEYQAKGAGGGLFASRRIAALTCPKCGSNVEKDTKVYGDTLKAECKSCGWKGTKTKISRRHTAVSLTNVSFDGPIGGNVAKGTDPSGNTVRFRLSDSDAKQLASVLTGDLGINFSGVDVDAGDIISEGRRHTAGEVPPQFKKKDDGGGGDDKGGGEEPPSQTSPKMDPPPPPGYDACTNCQGTRVSPQQPGAWCPNCNGTGITQQGGQEQPAQPAPAQQPPVQARRRTAADRTNFGVGGDHCPHCGADWKRPHDSDCLRITDPDIATAMEEEAMRDQGWETNGRGWTGMRKGAPFAGYDDFDDCTSQNSDKRDPDAYCGEIKHKTEDKKIGARHQAGAWDYSTEPTPGSRYVIRSEMDGSEREVPNERAAFSQVYHEMNNAGWGSGLTALEIRADGTERKIISDPRSDRERAGDREHYPYDPKPGIGWRPASRRTASTPSNILDAIQDMDPDGGSTQPTQADYDRFQQRVKQLYGDQAWKDYKAGGWADSEPDTFMGGWGRDSYDDSYGDAGNL